MTGPMDMVYSALGIDRVNMDNKMILILEQHGTNANFLVNAILSNALKKGNAVCFVLCHNTFGHYHNIGMRLGYNLLALKEKGQVTIVDPMKIIVSNIANMYKDSIDKDKIIIADATSKEHTDVVYKLFMLIREKYNEASKFNTSVVFIIDDINHLLDFGLNVYDVMYFMRYLRSFMGLHHMSQLCILVHTYREDLQASNADMVANGLKHMAHLYVATKSLKTGHSGDACGKLTVYWKIDYIRSKYYWVNKTTYLFKLLDWQVKIYAPGETSILS